MLSLLWACASPGGAHGTLTDAHGHAPLAGVVLQFATDSADCLRTATTGSDGAWRVVGLCPGHRYTVAPADPTWWVSPSPQVDGSGDTAVDVEAWRAPSSDGVYLLAGTELVNVATSTDVDTRLYAPAGRDLRLPTSLPGTWPTVDAAHTLVLSGKPLVADWTFEPLWDGPALTLGPAEAPETLWPWTYIGAKIDDAGALEVLHATVTGAVDVADGDRVVRYLGPGALPPGRYALTNASSRRAFLVAFE